MLQRARASYARYKDYLSKKKQDAEEAEKQKAKKEEKKKQLELEKQQEEEGRRALKRKQETLENKETELHAKEQQQHSVLKTAERLVAEAEQKLSAAMKDKNMDQVAVAHAMFEAASKKMKDANETLKEISLQRQDMMAQKKEVTGALNNTTQVEASAKKARTDDITKNKRRH